MSNILKPINYKNYPGCMFAMLSAFVESEQAKVLRSVAGDAVFRHEDEFKCTLKNGLYHSFDDKPAIFIPDYSWEWIKDGKWHREGDKPAVIEQGGDVLKYYNHDVLHRIGGPAITSNNIEDFQHEWLVNGKHHRIDGPAIYDNANEEWWVDGKRHRIGGPAVVRIGNFHGNHDLLQWWENGIFIRDEVILHYAGEY